MIDWRIYYHDGSTFDSSQGKPNDSPGFGIICIVQPDSDVGRVICCKWSHYFWHPEEKQWWGSEKDALLLRMAMREPCESPSYGWTVSTPRFNEILAAADADPDFLRRSGMKSNGDPLGEKRVPL